MQRISGIQSRFTIYGSRLLDERIKRDMKYIVQFLLDHQGPAPLASIWLGGAYGRGEGAVFRSGGQERPWFDYDLYLIYSQLDAGTDLQPLYRRWNEQMSAHLSLPVQLRSPGDVHAIGALEPRLSWYDLCLSHQVLWGNSDLIPQLRGGPVLPAGTALNLLLYWGEKLLELQAQLSCPDLPDSAHDTWYRVVTALGDAWLLSLDLYHVSTQERSQRFHSWQRDHGQPWSRELGYFYQEALQYRLQPSEFETMSSQLVHRIPELSRIFVQVYLGIFAQEVYKPLDLAQFERLFRERQQQPQPATWQLRHLIANLRQYRGRSFHAGWYLRPLLHRLYFLLPFLLERQLPSKTSLARVLPDLPAGAGLAEVKAQFLGLWRQVEDKLI
ncbi:MAG: hypothetical protein ACAI44_32550 [Candidatus Sericytochromatia bacterium]